MLQEILHDDAKMIFCAVAFAMFINIVPAFISLVLVKKFIANARVVKAKIVKLESLGDRDKAHVVFRDALGREVSAALAVPSKTYKENDLVEILSHKDKPAKVKLNSFMALWVYPVVLFASVAAAALALMALVSVQIAKLPF